MLRPHMLDHPEGPPTWPTLPLKLLIVTKPPARKEVDRHRVLMQGRRLLSQQVDQVRDRGHQARVRCARQALQLQADQQAAYRAVMGSAWPESGLVFTTRTGRPIEPRNLVRSFRRICDQKKVRLIKVHHLRHTVGSLLKDLGVPARDAQTILGHTRISTTLEIYTDTGDSAQRDALSRLHGLLDEAQD